MENHGYISLINWLIDASFKSHPRLAFPQFWINDFTRELFYSMLGDQLSGLVIMVMGLVIWTIYVWVEDTTTYKVATSILIECDPTVFFSFIRVWHFNKFPSAYLKGKSVLIYHLLTNCSHWLSTSKLYSVWFLGCGGGLSVAMISCIESDLMAIEWKLWFQGDGWPMGKQSCFPK